jgi:hypothetical protein
MFVQTTVCISGGRPQSKTHRGLGLPALFLLVFLSRFLANPSPIHSELALNRLPIAVNFWQRFRQKPFTSVYTLLGPLDMVPVEHNFGHTVPPLTPHPVWRAGADAVWPPNPPDAPQLRARHPAARLFLRRIFVDVPGWERNAMNKREE